MIIIMRIYKFSDSYRLKCIYFLAKKETFRVSVEFYKLSLEKNKYVKLRKKN